MGYYPVTSVPCRQKVPQDVGDDEEWWNCWRGFCRNHEDGPGKSCQYRASVFGRDTARGLP